MSRRLFNHILLQKMKTCLPDRVLASRQEYLATLLSSYEVRRAMKRSGSPDSYRNYKTRLQVRAGLIITSYNN
jgi:hypothetical protein